MLGSLVLLSSLYHLYLTYLCDPKSIEKKPLIDSQDLNNNCNGSNCDVQKSLELSCKLEPPHPSEPPKRTICQQFVLSFSAIQNTNKLLRVDNRYGVLDTIRLILTFFVYALQTFHFTAGFTAQMLRSVADTVPGELANSNAYWFARTPGIWIDGFMFTL